MLFNSFAYLIFLPIVFILYWTLAQRKLSYQNILLLIAGYVFYAWWSYKFLALLFLSTFLDYAYGFGVAFDNKKKAKLFLWLSIINNLGILALFKYYDFFVIEAQKLLQHIGWNMQPALLEWVLPVGISFYTFHGMSYVFDIYRAQQKPIKSFADYAVFVSFFPLLVAGPIERAHHLLPQIQRKRVFNYTQAVEGLRLILWGMFKKVVIADQLALRVNEIYERYPEQNGFTLVLGIIGFAFQIYGDFSGYTYIALGSAKLLGFELLSNFKFPYFSRNVAEFWNRWHISLSSWFRDYVYIPLGGSREGKTKTIRNIFIIFILSGLWHGANKTFIVWGFLHACGFLPLYLFAQNKKYAKTVVAANKLLPSIKELLQMLATFVFVSIAWVFFRAPTLHMAVAYLSRMCSDIYQYPKQFLQIPYGISILAYVVPLLLADWYLRRDERVLKVPQNKLLRYTLYAVLMFFTLYYLDLFSDGKKIDFIYFQF